MLKVQESRVKFLIGSENLTGHRIQQNSWEENSPGLHYPPLSGLDFLSGRGEIIAHNPFYSFLLCALQKHNMLPTNFSPVSSGNILAHLK